MKKRVLAAVFASSMILGLYGCGANSITTESKATESEATESEATESETTEPEATEPEATEPEATESEATESEATGTETINQVSLLQGLTFGDYHGSITVKELKGLGDIGIGTFDRLNGELIMLEGEVYRAAGDGTVEVVKDSETIPFSNVTFFDTDQSETLPELKDVSELKRVLDETVDTMGSNKFYMVRIDGTFDEMHVRSEYAQEEPYKPLATVLETDQTFYDYEDIKGTVVGLYCPSYMDRLNAVGWHFHFISDDRKAGGHVLDLRFNEAEVKWDETAGFNMELPDDEMFNGFDLTVDQSDDIKKVETGD